MKRLISPLTVMLVCMFFHTPALSQISGESEAFTFDTLSVPVSLSLLALAISVASMGFFLVRRYHLMQKKASGEC